MQLIANPALPSKERYGVFKSRLWSQLGLPMEFGERRFVIGNNSNYKARRARPYAPPILYQPERIFNTALSSCRKLFFKVMFAMIYIFNLYTVIFNLLVL